MISQDQKRLIERVVNVFETGSPEGEYDGLVVMADGKNGTRQITYGRSQTTEQGNLKKLLQRYAKNDGQFSNHFDPYLEKLGREPLADDAAFKKLLVRAAREDPVMPKTQDGFFDEHYYLPALRFFQENGFERALSLLVIYDSYIHSGRVPRFLRKRFGAMPPAQGGDEIHWTTCYVDIRHQWLKYHRNQLLRKTIYRTQCFKDQIDSGNWALAQLPIIANGISVE